jgi:hypothetical protein
MKTGYFNTRFCIFNDIKIYSNTNKKRHKIREEIVQIPKKLGLAWPGPKETGPEPTQNKIGPESAHR